MRRNGSGFFSKPILEKVARVVQRFEHLTAEELAEQPRRIGQQRCQFQRGGRPVLVLKRHQQLCAPLKFHTGSVWGLA